MIIITGTIEVAAARVDRARACFAAMTDGERTDPGCLAYGFWVDPDVPNRFRAYEEWESEQAITAHMATPHAAAFIEALPTLGITHSDVWRMEATRLSQVG